MLFISFDEFIISDELLELPVVELLVSPMF
jgi:hypothetical protein